MELYKELTFTNTESHELVFSMWSHNKVILDDDTDLTPMKSGETRVFKVLIQNKNERVFMLRKDKYMIIPCSEKH